MQRLLFLIFLCGVLTGCHNKHKVPVGTYNVNVVNKEGINGVLEIVGEPEDYFGRITFEGKRKRTFPIGLRFRSADSLDFLLAGGGYLRMKKDEEKWKGNFKYFGLEYTIEASRTGDASQELERLIPLKPLAKEVVFTNKDETFPCYHSASKTLYFTREGNILETVESDDDTWSQPQKVSFSNEFNDSAPYVFNDGESMLFTSNRTLPNSNMKKKNLWIVHKDSLGNWKTPEPLPSPVNIDSLGEYHAAISEKRNVFFVSYNRKGGYGRSDIYKGTPQGNDYQVENLGAVINTENSEADAFIHPKEAYILFASTNRQDSYGEDDIYISFQKDGAWTNPQNLGAQVNSFAYDYGAWIDSNENYFYFNSYRRGSSDIYRIPLNEIPLLAMDQK